MNLFKRLSAVAIATLLGSAGALAAVSPASAADELPTIIVFSNELVTDVDEEDATLIEDLELSGAVVETFDGGDGSAAAWEAALDGVDVLVFPERAEQIYDSTPADTDYLEVAAHTVLTDWVAAGGVVLISDLDGNTDDLLSLLTGEDFTSGWTTSDDEPYLKVIPDGLMPDELVDADATNAFDISALDPAAADLVTPGYISDDDYVAAAGIDALGSGFIGIFGWDWYPNTDEADIRRDWGSVLIRLLKSGFPALSAPGAPATVDIRLELDYLGSDGPRVFEVTGAAVGDGPELTPADEVENPSDFCGTAEVDIDPVAQVIILDAVEECDFTDVRLTVTSDEIGNLTLVEDELFLSDIFLDSGVESAQDEVQAAELVDFTGYSLDWDFSGDALEAAWTVDGESLLLYGISVFAYSPAELAATGVGDGAPLLAGAALLALLGGAALIVVRRRVATR